MTLLSITDPVGRGGPLIYRGTAAIVLRTGVITRAREPRLRIR